MTQIDLVGGREQTPVASMKALRILLVEGDASIGALLSEILEGIGHQICAAEASAANALAAAREWRPDLIFVDVGTNDAIGVAAVAEILREDFVPYVFVAGDALNALAFGANAILIQKPFRERDIADAIRQAQSPDGGASARARRPNGYSRPYFGGRGGDWS